tara:strand:+ start:174 stop:494 length:321 start_codon:yes stop_codon:yes gene_type:complete
MSEWFHCTGIHIIVGGRLGISENKTKKLLISIFFLKGRAKLMRKFSRFIKNIVLPDKVDKKRRKKILSEGIIETWTSEEQERKAKEAREIAKETYKKIRSSKTDKN